MKTFDKLRIGDRLSKVLEAYDGSWEGDPADLTAKELQQATAYLLCIVEAKVQPDLENIQELRDIINAIQVLEDDK